MSVFFLYDLLMQNCFEQSLFGTKRTVTLQIIHLDFQGLIVSLADLQNIHSVIGCFCITVLHYTTQKTDDYMDTNAHVNAVIVISANITKPKRLQLWQ